jgi:hypothetical protein
MYDALQQKNKHAAKSAEKGRSKNKQKLKAAQQICCVVRLGGDRRHGRLPEVSRRLRESKKSNSRLKAATWS